MRENGIIEQNAKVAGGLRRIDILTEVNQMVAIELKVVRTSITPRIRQGIATDVKSLRSGQVDEVI